MTMTNINDQILRGLADAALETTFYGEWINLEHGRKEVLDDFILADIPASEYLDRIYAGNLQSYANTLIAQ